MPLTFGNYKIPDKRYDKNNFAIHDYFFAKALDQVRPGGVVAFITTSGTLDKNNSNVRKYIAQRAELLGAVRLPNDAFLKNAGTEVTTDIIFLQKRDRLLDIQPDWVHLGMTEDGVPVNSYFAEHPEMILGKMVFDESMYGDTKDTACHPIEGADLAAQLQEAIGNIHGQITEMEYEDTDAPKDVSIPADPNVRNYSYTLIDDTVYFRENSRMYPAEMPAATLERVKGMVELRDCVHTLIEYQLDEYGDQAIAEKQAELNQLYNTFTKKHGLINASANGKAFASDSAYYLLCSLEVLDENGELDRKADMFNRRTIKQKSVVTSVDTASEALTVSIAERARIDLDFMQSLTGLSEEELLENLHGAVYADYDFDVYSNNIKLCQVNGCSYRTADDFLSGNVREKLQHYKDALEVLPADSPYRQVFSDNAKALEAVQPKDLDASEISVRLGTTWIDKDYINQFVHELLQPPSYLAEDIKVNYFPYTGEWNVAAQRRVPGSNVLANVTFGTGRMNAYRIIEDTLNLKDVRVYDTIVEDGKEKRVLNKKETTLAQQKQESIKQVFQDWIFKDPNRRRDLVQTYNERFNSTRPREYDGSHINFAGISPEITLRTHQLNAIAHILYGGNTLLAHEVGAGKTFEMVASAMELKRLGLAQKSLFAVPNHLTEQWASEFLRLYPSANILVATAKDFEMKNRKKFCAKIATGDYDAVIIGHSQLEKIPLSKERQERLLNEQIWEITEGIDELKRNDGERFSIKQLEKTKKSLEARLERLTDDSRKDDVVTFEQLGVDRLFVDEAHSFKNLFLYTKMRNVAGLSQTEAQKSSDLFGKCRYLDELTDNKGVIFATGTPISNSMAEMYTMQRYLQYETLKKNGLTHFDCWASTFGETTTAIELAPEGTGYRARTRFAKFHNLPELMCMFKDVADIKTADMMDLPRPKANFNTVVVKPSELQTQMVKDLSKRAAEVHRGSVDPTVDNMLKITSDGRKIGLDQRLINDMLPDDEGSKVNACMNEVYQIWNDTKADKLTQLVFCDFSTPNADGRFNVYDDIRDKLLQKGIPEDEIAFIHGANTEVRKKELFAKVRQGKVRVLLGSTFKMGSGTNVQDRLIHLHDLDCPWRPSDLEQRAGRIVRQGNMNEEVGITRYVTEGTFDAYLYQTIENKQKFISQIMSSKSPVRSCEDVDETALSYAEIKALCAGNPMIKEKMDLDIEVARLKLLKADHQSQHYRLEDNLLTSYPQQIERAKEQIKGFNSDNERIEAGTKPNKDGFSPMEISGIVHHDKKQAGEALLEACKKVKGTEAVKIGSYRGLDMNLAFDTVNKQFVMSLKGNMSYGNSHAGTLLGVALGTDVFGNITRINNAITELPQRLDSVQKHLENLHLQVENAKNELQKPFQFEAELEIKSARLAFLDAELNMDSTREERGPEQMELESVAKAPPRAAIAKGKPSIIESLKAAAAETKTAVGKPKAAEITM
jgi:DNA methylase